MAARERRLTPRQVRFVEAYLQCWSPTEAARRSGYKGTNQDVVGAKNMRNPLIAQLVSQRMQEVTMSTDEALVRLDQMGTTNIADFIEPDEQGGIELNWENIQKYGHLVKSVKMTEYGPVIELEDRQAAIDKVLRARGAYKSNVDITSGGQPLKGYVSVSPDDWDASAE